MNDDGLGQYLWHLLWVSLGGSRKAPWCWREGSLEKFQQSGTRMENSGRPSSPSIGLHSRRAYMAYRIP